MTYDPKADIAAVRSDEQRERACVVEQLGIVVQLGQEATRLEQRGFIFGHEMARGMLIEQRLEGNGWPPELLKDARGHPIQGALLIGWGRDPRSRPKTAGITEYQEGPTSALWVGGV